MKKILFICMGNICRSPSAEAVFQKLLNDRGLADQFVLDSAGTHSYHIGSKPDARSIKAAAQRRISMDHLRARQVTAEDFERFDLLVTMDRANQLDLQRMFPSATHDKVVSMMAFDETSDHQEVPDPYYGSGDGFELVLDLLEQASEGLLSHLSAKSTN